MQARAFYKAVTVDRSDLLERLLADLGEHGVRFCVIGGQSVNAYVEPLVSLDLDLVVAFDQIEVAVAMLAHRYRVERFPHSVNVTAPDSDLRVQIQTDPRYAGFVDRAEIREVLGTPLPVASLRDVLQGKVWAAQDSERRRSKRQKDFADIARLLEAFPDLRAHVPQDVLDRLV
jgi:hypothetical protein